MTLPISVTVNGTVYQSEVTPRLLLVDFLRENLRLVGTNAGCEHGVCGTCTVLLDGNSVRSCLMFTVQADRTEIITVEGLADGDELHPMQRAFTANHALQCGFCTPGMMISAIDVVGRYPDVDEAELREHLSGNICRCTGYHNIIVAVQEAAVELKGGQ